MKNTILISAVIAIGTVAAAFLVKKKRDARAIRSANAFVKKSHHITEVFSRAKENN
jgi:hypothetical protein